MANNNWILNYSANYSTASGWSLAHVPTTGEVAIFSNTFGSGSCTFDQNIVCSGITISGNYTGNQTANGYGYYLTGDMIDDGTGTRNLGSGIFMSGPLSNLHIGSGLGTVTATSCDIVMNTSTSGVIDDDKGITFKSLILGASAIVTNNGISTSTYSTSGIPWTMGNNSTFTISTRINFERSTSGDMWSIGTGCTISSSTTLYFRCIANSITVNLPAITMTSAGFTLEDLVGYTGWAFNVSGNLSLGSTQVNMYCGANSTGTFTFNTYNLTCGTLRYGLQSATSSSATFNWGSGTHTISVMSGSTWNSANTTNVNLQSSTWNCSGSWTFGSNHTINPGTSTVNITNTSTISQNGKPFYDVNLTAGGSGPVTWNGDGYVHTLNSSDCNAVWSSYAMNISGNMLLDGARAYNLGSGIIMTSSTGTLHFGSTISTVTATSCDIQMNTATSGVIDDDKGITFKSLTLGSGAIVTSTGAQTTTFAAGSNLTPITLGANSTLTNNSLFVASLTGSPTIISLGSGYTLNGNKRIQFAHTGNGTVTVPAITSLTWIEFLVSSTGITTIDFNGIVNMPNAALNIVQISTGTTTWNTNNYAITCSTFRSGGHSGGGVFIGNFGSSIINLATYIAYSNNINATYNFQSSTWNCSSIWNYGSLHTINPGSSIVNILPTTNTNIFSSGKAFATLNFSGSNPNVTGFFADQPILSGNLGVYGGISVNTSGLNIPITSGCYITTSGNFTSSGVYTIGKDLTFGSGTILNNSGMILNLSGQAHTITTGGRNFPYTKVYDNSTWLGSGTISRLSLYAPTVSTTHTWEAGKVYRFTSYTANDWSGTDYSHQVLFRSSANGFQTIFYAPSNTITKFTNYADINNLGSEIDASDGSSTNGGNNYGINFGVGVVHPRRPHDKNDVDFFIITKTFRW